MKWAYNFHKGLLNVLLDDEGYIIYAEEYVSQPHLYQRAGWIKWWAQKL